MRLISLSQQELAAIRTLVEQYRASQLKLAGVLEYLCLAHNASPVGAWIDLEAGGIMVHENGDEGEAESSCDRKA